MAFFRCFFRSSVPYGNKFDGPMVLNMEDDPLGIEQSQRGFFKGKQELIVFGRAKARG